MLKYAPFAYPSLENLSHILRNRDLWPEGFYWNFKHCDSCAIGMMNKLWGHAYPEVAVRVFEDMPGETESRIFYNSFSKPHVRIGWFGLFKRDRHHEEVTPEMVADQIDEYLKRKEGNTFHAQHGTTAAQNSREIELSRVPA